MNPGLFSWWIQGIKKSIFPDVKKAACSTGGALYCLTVENEKGCSQVQWTRMLNSKSLCICDFLKSHGTGRRRGKPFHPQMDWLILVVIWFIPENLQTASARRDEDHPAHPRQGCIHSPLETGIQQHPANSQTPVLMVRGHWSGLQLDCVDVRIHII